MSEDVLAKDTRIVFWGRAADYNDTTKVLTNYRESERSNFTRTFTQSGVTTNAPTKTADWLSTGEPSMTFAGDEGLVGDFNADFGSFAIIAAGSFTSAASGIVAMFGNSNTTADMRIGRNGAYLYAFTGGAGALGGLDVVAATKQVYEWVCDPEALGRSMRANAGTWDDNAMTAHFDIEEAVTPSIGYTSTDKDYPLSGDIAEFFIVSVPTRGAPWSDLGASINSYLAAKYSIS